MSDLWTTAMGTWCDDLADLMLPFHRLVLTRGDLVFAGSGTPGFSYAVNDPCPDGFSPALKSDLAQVMAHYPMGAHLRLEICSFRTGAATPRVVGMNGALWLMRQANPRVSGVIRRGLSDGQTMSLFVFPWLPIPQWAEFRIFIRHHKMIGISQYHPKEAFAQIAQHEAAIMAGMQTFLQTVLPRLKKPDLVLDVLAEPLAKGGFRIRLVDMALLGPRSDTCLFTFENGGDFDGTLRFRRADNTLTMAAPIAIATDQTLAPVAQLGRAPSAPDDDFWRT
jgi:hypothetical protein